MGGSEGGREGGREGERGGEREGGREGDGRGMGGGREREVKFINGTCTYIHATRGWLTV